MVSFIEIIKNRNRIKQLKEKMTSQCLPAFDKYEESDSMCPHGHLMTDLCDIHNYFVNSEEIKNQSGLSNELYHSVVEAYFNIVLERCHIFFNDYLYVGSEFSNMYLNDATTWSDVADKYSSHDLPIVSNFSFFIAIQKCHTQ